MAHGICQTFQQRYDVRKREEEEQLSQISDEALEGWIAYMRDEPQGKGKAADRRIIQQSVA